MNVGCGPAEERVLLTGLHAVADIYCENCKTTLGWKYVSQSLHLDLTPPLPDLHVLLALTIQMIHRFLDCNKTPQDLVHFENYTDYRASKMAPVASLKNHVDFFKKLFSFTHPCLGPAV